MAFRLRPGVAATAGLMVIIDDERGLPALVVLRVGAIQLSGDLWEIWASGQFRGVPGYGAR